MRVLHPNAYLIIQIMKNLTQSELLRAPVKVQYIYRMALFNQPVSNSYFEETVKLYPDYFPDEVEYRKKWDLIPQSVHDAYNSEMQILRNEMYKKLTPVTTGIFALVKDSDVLEEWGKFYDECRRKEIPLAMELHKKHYGAYGIVWNGW